MTFCGAAVVVSSAFLYSSGIWIILRNLGGLGLLLAGLTDGGVIPVPGATDGLTILLAARHPESWLYYAAMATVGSVLGGSLTYRFGSVHGQSVLTKRIGSARSIRLSQLFGRWGFFAIALPAMLPLPVYPFLLTAGAVRYPWKPFLAALACGRSIKYFGLAFLASFYGRRVLANVLSQYKGIFFWIAAGVILAAVAIYGIAIRLKADQPVAGETVGGHHRSDDTTTIDQARFTRIAQGLAESKEPGGIDPVW